MPFYEGSVSRSRRYDAAVPYVYLLRCRDGTLYAGAAVDLARRLRDHRAGRASRYTRARLPVELAWSQEVATWGEALREEARIKRLGRAGKLALCKSREERM